MEVMGAIVDNICNSGKSIVQHQFVSYRGEKMMWRLLPFVDRVDLDAQDEEHFLCGPTPGY
jgi:hypothetical protein